VYLVEELRRPLDLVDDDPPRPLDGVDLAPEQRRLLLVFERGRGREQVDDLGFRQVRAKPGALPRAARAEEEEGAGRGVRRR
jgi:hypothetical protein